MLYKAQARKNPLTGEAKYYPIVVLNKETDVEKSKNIL